jgi:glycerate kinase
MPEAHIRELPLSDGGPGLIDSMLLAQRGERIEVSCHDALMRPISGEIALLPDRTAVIEMASAAGLVLLDEEERDPLIATTYGVGELIAAALGHSPAQIIVGVGGSATVDGGAGAMQALGAHLLDAEGHDLGPGGAVLAQLDRIDPSGVDPRLGATTVRVAADVRNVLCGGTGAARVFGPQKGATPEGVRVLDAALARFANVALRDCGVDVATMPGSGAAGGLGAGLVALCGATIESGFDLVAEVTRLRAAIERCDAVITGEGRLDAQSQYGKTTFGVARMARSADKPVGVIAGTVEARFDQGEVFDAVERLATADDVEASTRESTERLMAAAARIAGRLAELAR